MHICNVVSMDWSVVWFSTPDQGFIGERLSSPRRTTCIARCVSAAPHTKRGRCLAPLHNKTDLILGFNTLKRITTIWLYSRLRLSRRPCRIRRSSVRFSQVPRVVDRNDWRLHRATRVEKNKHRTRASRNDVARLS